MESRQIDNAQWMQLKDLVAERFGLHIPDERLDHLHRSVAAVRDVFDFADDAACIERLLAAPLTAAHAQALASELTIGETYFFREPAALAAFADKIVPELIRARRGAVQRLRILSAGCCTGEEAYSLAIMIRQRYPELMRGWDVQIIGADLNARFLEQAKTGIYKEWSFRAAPGELKQRYFSRTRDGRYRIVPEIRRMVRFRTLNLAEDRPFLAARDLCELDVIFCRNVLMYFTSEQLQKVIARLHASLSDGGWLIVSPSEASTALFEQFVPVYASGAILFRRIQAAAPSERVLPVRSAAPAHSASVRRRKPQQPAPPQTRSAASTDRAVQRRVQDAIAGAESMLAQARYAEAAELLQAAFAAHWPDERGLGLLVRALANRGSLGEAESWCDRWIERDKLNASARYMRAVVLIELGRRAEARAALQQALYLDPGFELAHFALGNLALRDGDRKLARRSFENALRLLNEREPEERLAESGGMCVREIAELIGAVMRTEHVS